MPKPSIERSVVDRATNLGAADRRLIHLWVPTWVPFRLQFYCNGHSRLARQLGLRTSPSPRPTMRNVSTTLIQPGSEFKLYCGALFGLVAGGHSCPRSVRVIRGSVPPSCLGSAKRYVTDRSGAGLQCIAQWAVETVDTRDVARTEEAPDEPIASQARTAFRALFSVWAG
jgi:hypothetical protein